MHSLDADKPVVVFGLGSFAGLITKYLGRYTSWQITAYTADDAFCGTESYLDKPVVPFSALAESYPSDSHDAVVAIGYHSMGDVREQAFLGLKQQGYHVRNFIHPDASCGCDAMGEGNIILERAIVSLGTTLGDANLIWCGSNIAHDCTIGSYNTFCPSSAFGGFTHIGDHCFFGINSTCKNGIDIASYTFVGANAYVTRDTCKDDAYIARATEKVDRRSSKSIARFLGD